MLQPWRKILFSDLINVSGYIINTLTTGGKSSRVPYVTEESNKSHLHFLSQHFQNKSFSFYVTLGHHKYFQLFKLCPNLEVYF